MSARGTATEVELSGDFGGAAKRLGQAQKHLGAQRVKIVTQQHNMGAAKEAMQRQGLKGTVSNVKGNKTTRT